jgi:hypothetical protein
MTAERKFTVNSNTTSACGTSLKGQVYTTYDKLVSALGKPKGGSADGKTTCEWIVEFEDGSVVTIHDWKTSNTPKDPYNWNVGAKNHTPLDYLEALLETRVVSTKY